jgi:hypothetical protein
MFGREEDKTSSLKNLKPRQPILQHLPENFVSQSFKNPKGNGDQNFFQNGLPIAGDDSFICAIGAG